MILQRNHSRSGLTLFEVVLAMFIFMFSIIAIWQLVTMGSDRALQIQVETRTSARCQSKMAEVIIGAQELTSSGSYTKFEDTDLYWKLDVEPGPGNGLYNVKVSVRKELPSGIIESQLSQIVLDPMMRGTSLDRANPPEASTPTMDPATTPSETTPPSTTPPSTTPPSTTSPPSSTTPPASTTPPSGSTPKQGNTGRTKGG
jgi:hypothetical protein